MNIKIVKLEFRSPNNSEYFSLIYEFLKLKKLNFLIIKFTHIWRCKIHVAEPFKTFGLPHPSRPCAPLWNCLLRILTSARWVGVELWLICFFIFRCFVCMYIPFLSYFIKYSGNLGNFGRTLTVFRLLLSELQMLLSSCVISALNYPCHLVGAMSFVHLLCS